MKKKDLMFEILHIEVVNKVGFLLDLLDFDLILSLTGYFILDKYSKFLR